MNPPSIWEGVGIALLVSSPVFLVAAIYWSSYYDIAGSIYRRVTDKKEPTI